MRHRIAGRKFGRSAAHRQSMTRNQVTSLLRHGRITTTEAKAKELRRWVERVITDAKPDDLSARRKVALYVNDREVSNKLFGTYLERYKERPGGYTESREAAPAPQRRGAHGDHRAGRVGRYAVPTYSLTLEYDGTDFAGWQIQPRVRTAMGVLREAIHAVTSERPALTAAGRTNSGAHAHGQVVGCTLERAWAPRALRNALNAALPADLAVRDVALQSATFDARRDAVERTYRYLIVCRDARTPVLRRNAWTVRGPLDVDAMVEAARYLVGTHDFAAFGSAPRVGGSTVRRVTAVSVDEYALGGGEAPEHAEPVLATVTITVHADAFLRGMMRSFAGALVKVGQGRATPEWLAGLVDSAVARDASVSVAPARGLHQWSVRYRETISQNEERAA